jgi:hypothetical protein
VGGSQASLPLPAPRSLLSLRQHSWRPRGHGSKGPVPQPQRREQNHAGKVLLSQEQARALTMSGGRNRVHTRTILHTWLQRSITTVMFWTSAATYV